MLPFCVACVSTQTECSVRYVNSFASIVERKSLSKQFFCVHSLSQHEGKKGKKHFVNRTYLFAALGRKTLCTRIFTDVFLLGKSFRREKKSWSLDAQMLSDACTFNYWNRFVCADTNNLIQFQSIHASYSMDLIAYSESNGCSEYIGFEKCTHHLLS